LSQTSGHTELVEAQLQLSADRVSSALHVVTVVLNHPMLVYTDPPAMHQFLSNPHPKSYAPQLSSSLNPLHASAAQSPFMSVKSS
jgi:hypothetical protein